MYSRIGTTQMSMPCLRSSAGRNVSSRFVSHSCCIVACSRSVPKSCCGAGRERRREEGEEQCRAQKKGTSFHAAHDNTARVQSMRMCLFCSSGGDDKTFAGRG